MCNENNKRILRRTCNAPLDLPNEKITGEYFDTVMK